MPTDDRQKVASDLVNNLAYLPEEATEKLRSQEVSETAIQAGRAAGQGALKTPDRSLLLGQALRAQGATLATAESCTGGLLSALVTAVPGASDYFLGGVVSYANQVKERLLGVPAQTLATQGAVSRATVEAMARGVRSLIGTTYGVAISGIAGPGGGTPEKPVGTVHFAVDSPVGCVAGAILHPGSRDEIRAVSADAALDLLLQVVQKNSNRTELL